MLLNAIAAVAACACRPALATGAPDGAADAPGTFSGRGSAAGSAASAGAGQAAAVATCAAAAAATGSQAAGIAANPAGGAALDLWSRSARPVFWLNRMALHCAATRQANHGWRKLSSSRRISGRCKLAHPKCSTWRLVLALRPSCDACCSSRHKCCSCWSQLPLLAAALLAGCGCRCEQRLCCWLQLFLLAEAVLDGFSYRIASSRSSCQQQMSLPTAYALASDSYPCQQRLALLTAVVHCLWRLSLSLASG